MKKRLLPYIDGELSRAERSQVEKHLAGCAQCRKELEYLRSLTSALRCAAPEADSVPVDLWPRVAPQITKVPQRSAGWLSGSRVQMAGAAAALLLIVVVGFGIIGRFGETGRFDRVPMARAPGMPGMGGPQMGGPGGMGPGGPPMPGPGGMPGSPPGGMGGPAMPGPPMPGGPMSMAPQPGQTRGGRIAPGAALPERYTPGLAKQGKGEDTTKMKMAKAPPEEAEMARNRRLPDIPGTPEAAAGAKPEGAKEAPVRTVRPAAPGSAVAPAPMPGGYRGAQGSPPAADMAAGKDEALTLAKPGPMGPGPAPSAMGSLAREPGTKETAIAKAISMPQIEDIPPSQWRKMAQEARKEGKTKDLAAKFEAAFDHTKRTDIGLFLLDFRMNPVDKPGLVRTADSLSRIGSSSQSFWLRVGQGYEIAGKLNAAQASYNRALSGGDEKTAAAARAKLDRLRTRK